MQSYTVRNNSWNHIPDPVDHMLVDVKHRPGINMPDPVKHVKYTENHPGWPLMPPGAQHPAWAAQYMNQVIVP